MDFQEYIKPELLIVIPVLYIIGRALKRSTMPDKWIPFVLGFVSILISAAWVLSTTDIICFQDGANAVFVSITQGVLAAGASVYANQLYRQLKKDE